MKESETAAVSLSCFVPCDNLMILKTNDDYKMFKLLNPRRIFCLLFFVIFKNHSNEK
jgi:hypothetical protein